MVHELLQTSTKSCVLGSSFPPKICILLSTTRRGVAQAVSIAAAEAGGDQRLEEGPPGG
jgi:hypothetical protein